MTFAARVAAREPHKNLITMELLNIRQASGASNSVFVRVLCKLDSVLSPIRLTRMLRKVAPQLAEFSALLRNRKALKLGSSRGTLLDAKLYVRLDRPAFLVFRPRKSCCGRMEATRGQSWC